MSNLAAYFGAWLFFTAVFLVVGVFFVTVAKAMAFDTGDYLSENLARSFAAFIALVGVLLVGNDPFYVVFGIWTAAVPIFVIGALFLLGYTVVAADVGRTVIKRRAPNDLPSRPYTEMLTGVLIVQLVVLVPVIGQLVGLFACYLGSGALSLTAFHQLRHSQN